MHEHELESENEQENEHEHEHQHEHIWTRNFLCRISIIPILRLVW
jgi:hypothetical protein